MSSHMARPAVRRRHVHHRRAADPEAVPIAVPEAVALPLALPDKPNAVLTTPDLTRRDGTHTSTATATSAPSSSISSTIPIAIGVVVPICIAAIVFIVLHKRNVKRFQREEENDRHKSLDFGMDVTDGSKSKRGKPEMSGLESSIRKGRGMSLDIGTPYMLPAALTGSRESLHSLSRNIDSKHDPYRPATAYSSHESTRNPYAESKRGNDDASTRTASTAPRYRQDSMSSNLLNNAQQMPQSVAPLRSPLASSAVQGGLKPAPAAELRDSYAGLEASALRKSNNYLGDFITSGSLTDDPEINPPQAAYDNAHPARGSSGVKSPRPENNFNQQGQQAKRQSPISSKNANVPTPAAGRKDNYLGQIRNEQADFNQNSFQFNEIVVPPSRPGSNPQYAERYEMPGSEDFYTPAESTGHGPIGLGVSELGHDDRRLSIMRPLPPDDPADNPEQRANRIRSFYKEYFSENEPARAFEPAAGAYYEDYGQEYQGDGTTYDPVSNQFVVAQAPYAEPVTRRAMTPPPRGPPRFQGGARHQHNNSNPGPQGPRGRAFSSASTSRLGPSARGPQKRPPPPSALRTLPTPSQLREDAFALPIDFAPPSKYKDRAAGRPESPFMEMRPYSPSLPVANPLVSSFNELPVMPSPHHLRKSGFFTGLDFAPPPRFKNGGDSASDNGSIRSGRSTNSTMSAAQLRSIRTGAYRVSRIPKELVGTSTEINDSLKPTWKVGS